MWADSVRWMDFLRSLEVVVMLRQLLVAAAVVVVEVAVAALVVMVEVAVAAAVVVDLHLQ